MTREELEEYIRVEYGIVPDHPFGDGSNSAVFRHSDNRKWFALVMRIPGTKLGLAEPAPVDVVNVKCAPELRSSFLGRPGIYPAYHMNHNHWLSLLLSPTLAEEDLRFLLGISYDLTK